MDTVIRGFSDLYIIFQLVISTADEVLRKREYYIGVIMTACEDEEDLEALGRNV